ncbi:MAG: alpha-1,2-fucosyltransferase [Lachnospiraceae bacterium]|nr:alpha-1,2-fucosyltransferase [Lachnospiraceae bacterium]
MIGTEFLKGQGLGNQLFCYVSARCIARDLGYDFGTAGQEELAVNIHSKRGMYFMDMDLGRPVKEVSAYGAYREADRRLYMRTCVHDMTHGCYVAGADEGVYGVPDNTLLYGNLQAERYFLHHRAEIREWLRVKEEYDSHAFTRDNLCIINIRGGEYADSRVLFLRRKYWLDAMDNMRKIRSDMEFMVVTDDVEAAGRVLPEVKAHHFDLAGDYVTIKNARYLILSNSTFGFFPAFTSTTAEKVIAPKYWARHNVSDGYWASEQNIYEGFLYQDRRGRLFTARECRQELEAYKRRDRHSCRGYSEQAVRRQAAKDQALYYGDKAIRRLQRMVKKG